MRAFRLAYDGRPYHGFQRQPAVHTVEDALFGALQDLGVCETEPSEYSAAGRTDAGVSALAQTVAFEAPDWLSPAALNGALPADVRAWAAADVVDFHAQHDAREREYTYYLHGPSLDDERVPDGAQRLVGEHDYHNLTPDDAGTVRSLAIDVERDGPFLVLRVSAGGFPRQLVRRLVSLLGEVGEGASLDRVDRVLSSEPLDGAEGIGPAPAYPLVLTDVTYDVDFSVDAEAAESAQAVFDEVRVEHRTVSRVAERIRRGMDD